jgi:hypothetical protein
MFFMRCRVNLSKIGSTYLARLAGPQYGTEMRHASSTAAFQKQTGTFPCHRWPCPNDIENDRDGRKNQP